MSVNLTWCNMVLIEHGFGPGPRDKDRYLLSAWHFCLTAQKTLVAFHGLLRHSSLVSQASTAEQSRRYPLSTGR